MVQMLILYGLPGLTLLACIAYWWQYGRGARLPGTVIAEYTPPTDLSPGEAGILYDYKASDLEITATMVDLNRRGYLAIGRAQHKQFFGSHSVFTFTLLRDDVLSLKDHEKALLNGLFGVVGVKEAVLVQSEITDPAAQAQARTYESGSVSLVGKTVSVEELQPYFYQYVTEAQDAMFDSLIGRGYFVSDPRTAGASVLILGVLVAIAGVCLVGHVSMFSLFITAASLLLCGMSIRTRGGKGQRAKQYVDGFRLYIQTAELNEIVTLDTPATAEYAQGKAAIYNQYLPYAIALGLEGQWTKRFDGAYDGETYWAAGELTSTIAAALAFTKN